MRRYKLTAGVVALAACLLFRGALPVHARNAPARSTRPNLLLIVADDLGYGDLSGYGARDIQTPNIDALIASGMRFERFYANSPVCSPTRAALLSGRYPDMVGVPGVIRADRQDSWGFLSPSVRLLPQLLAENGYDTALVGKWHLGLESPNLPGERGFKHFRGFLGDMVDDYYTHLRYGKNYMRAGRRQINTTGHATDLFTDWAVEYIRARRPAGRPFFLYLAHLAPHVPLQPPAGWLERVTRRERGITPQRAKLAALIEHLDDGIGRVVSTLKATGQYENTMIVFTSDNGGQLNAGASSGELRGGKEELYEGGIRVPLGVVWPGRIQPGTRTARVALTMDLLPTFFDAAGIAPGAALDGSSILPVLTGRAAAPTAERALFWMRREGGGFYHGGDYYAVRRGRWKLMQNHPHMPFRLYDLDADPHEDRDAAKENGAVVEELSRLLRAHLRLAGAVPWQRRDN